MAAVHKKIGRPVNLGPELPREGAWIWSAFVALDDTRDIGMGVGAITFTEMVSYADLWGFRWNPVEITIIRALDRAYRVFKAERQAKRQKPAIDKSKPPK